MKSFYILIYIVFSCIITTHARSIPRHLSGLRNTISTSVFGISQNDINMLRDKIDEISDMMMRLQKHLSPIMDGKSTLDSFPSVRNDVVANRMSKKLQQMTKRQETSEV